MMQIYLIKINASNRDKIVKQSCYFVKICDGEFNKNTQGSTFFHSNFVYMKKMLNILHENSAKCVSRCWGLLVEDFRAIWRSFDKSLKSKYHTYF